MIRRIFSIAMVLLGCAALVLKRHWQLFGAELVWSYGGNVAASFAVYFIVGIVDGIRARGPLVIAAAAIIVVSLFEVTDGFGVMSNVYDPVDLGANVVGVALALLIDVVVDRLFLRHIQPE